MSKDNKATLKIAGYILLVATILWTAFIFYNSLQTATESLEQSGVFVNMFTNIAKAIYGDELPVGLVRYIELRLVDDIRCMAHIFEFFVLYIFANLSLKSFKKINSYSVIAFLYGLVIIATDETIQIFVDGRGFQIIDMLFDSIGMGLAYLVILLINYLRIRKNPERVKHD